MKSLDVVLKVSVDFIFGLPEETGKDLAAHLGKLANKGLQFGQWKKQQQTAHDSLSFISTAAKD